MQDWARAFYTSNQWRNCRAAFLAAHNWQCDICKQQGKLRPAKIVHHRELLTPTNIGNPDIALNWGNLQALCQDCHNAIHNKPSVMRHRFDAMGRLIRPQEDI